MASSIEVAGGAGAIYFSFHDAPHYSLSNPIAGDVIDAVKADRGFAPPVSELQMTAVGNSSAAKHAGHKRGREDA